MNPLSVYSSSRRIRLAVAKHPIAPALQQGFILMPVVIAIVLIATIAFMLANQGASNVNETGSVLAAAQAKQLAGAGLAHASWRAQNNSCSGDASMSNVVFGQHNYTATIDAGGATTTNYTISPDRDSWIKQASPDENNAGASLLSIKKKSGDGFSALFHYDLSSIPNNQKVVTATAWFYLDQVDNQGALSLHPLTIDWLENDATWNTISTNFETATYGLIPQQFASGVWVSVNITGLAQSWVNNPANNYGVLINASVSDLESRLASKEAVANQRPYLQLTTADAEVSPVNISATGNYTGNPSPAKDISRSLSRTGVAAHQTTTIYITRPGSEGKDGWVDKSRPSDNYGVTGEMIISGGANPKHFMTEFDLSAIPYGSKIVSASYEMDLNYAGSSTTAAEYSIYRMTQAWTEGTGDYWNPGDGANWNTSDGSNAWSWNTNHDASSPVATTRINPGLSGRHSWDITSLVQQWVSGQQPNFGLLVTGNASANGSGFAGSDWSTASKRPQLSITYSCECGSPCLAPQGAGNLLMVISGGSPSTTEADKIALFESWGYTVNTVDMNSGQVAYNNKMNNNDVVYLPQSVDPLKVNTKLSAATIGVVSEHGALNDELGIATGFANPVAASINITDTSHYITQVFSTGSLAIFSAGMEQLTVSGTQAPGLQALAESSGNGSLVVLEKGDMTTTGATTPGRRVMLPLGRDNRFNWDFLNANGRLIVQRAIQWGRFGAAVAVAPGYLDQFNSRSCDLATDYTGSNGTLDWSGEQWQEQDNNNSCSGSVRLLDHQGSNRLTMTSSGGWNERKVDLSSFTGATLVIDYLQIGALDSSRYLSIKFSGDNGSSWTELGRIDTPGDGTTYLSASYVIPQALVNADSMLRFENKLLLAGRAVYLDNINIVESAPTNTLLLVVDNPAGLSAQDIDKKALIESWGYTVNLIDDGAPQTEFDTAVLANTVVYVSATSSDTLLSTKLVSASIGVVNEKADLVDEFGFSTNRDGNNATDMDITDNSHYITSVFPTGTLVLHTGSQPSYQLGGTLAAGLNSLADGNGNAPALATLETGAALSTGGNSAGRRVKLPWGGAAFDHSQMNTDGETIMRRAIEWAAGAGTGGGGGSPPPDEVVFEEFTDTKNGGNGKSMDIAKPSGLLEGDLLIAAIVTDGKQGDAGIQAPAGWNLVNHGIQSEQVSMGVWWKLAGASEPAQYHFTWPEDQEAYGWIMRFTGHDPVNPINASASGGGSSSSPTSPAVTTTVDNARILRIGGFDDDDINVGDPGLTGHTAITMDKSSNGNGTVSGGAGYITQATAGNSGTSTFSLNQSEQYRAVTIGIAPAP